MIVQEWLAGELERLGGAQRRRPWEVQGIVTLQWFGGGGGASGDLIESSLGSEINQKTPYLRVQTEYTHVFVI